MAKKQPKAYAAAGVDIDLGNRVKAGLPALLASTHRRGVLGKVGGFGGLFALDTRRFQQPVLVSSVDGVGTKLKVAFAVGRHDTVGQDLVNHCVNDIAVIGAEPLFFLDYIGTGRLEPGVFRQIVRGFARACTENRCALIGGETAQMPGFYQPGEYDLSGTIVGVVERSRMLDGPRDVRVGDTVIGVASNGLHTNGYSLARRILFDQLGWKPSTFVPELGTSVGAELLRIHRSYGPLAQSLLKRFTPAPRSPRRSSSARARSRPALRALAHITGGGFLDNIPRVLPDRCDVVVRRGTWPIPAIFELLAGRGAVPDRELYQVFNMGIGLVAIVDPAQTSALLRATRAAGHAAWVIGEVTRGRGTVRLV